MPQERTPEQIAADDALDEAIRNVVEVYKPEGRPASIITASIVVYAETWYDEEGDGITAIGRHVPAGGTVPYHVLIGMIETARAHFLTEVVATDEDQP